MKAEPWGIIRTFGRLNFSLEIYETASTNRSRLKVVKAKNRGDAALPCVVCHGNEYTNTNMSSFSRVRYSRCTMIAIRRKFSYSALIMHTAIRKYTGFQCLKAMLEPQP